MPDNAKKIENDQRDAGVAVKPSALGLGERLRSARKARALSLEHVSETLHLDETIVLALEDERFDVLGAPVFVRGHLKAYARLVGLSPDSVLDAFNETERLPEVVPTVNRESDHSVTVNPVMWGFWALVILLGFSLGIYLLAGDDTDSPAPATVTSPVEPDPGIEIAPPVATMPVVDDPLPIGQDLQPDTLPIIDDAIAPAEDDMTAAGRQDEAPIVVMSEPEPVIAVQQTRLSLHFLEESWVEISDAERRLLFGLQRAGRRRELTGEPPFDLLVGNATGVEIQLNGRPFDIPAADISGKVARFVITRADIE